MNKIRSFKLAIFYSRFSVWGRTAGTVFYGAGVYVRMNCLMADT
jgi:hypothetical protein